MASDVSDAVTNISSHRVDRYLGRYLLSNQGGKFQIFQYERFFFSQNRYSTTRKTWNYFKINLAYSGILCTYLQYKENCWKYANNEPSCFINDVTDHMGITFSGVGRWAIVPYLEVVCREACNQTLFSAEMNQRSRLTCSSVTLAKLADRRDSQNTERWDSGTILYLYVVLCIYLLLLEYQFSTYYSIFRNL